MTRAAPAATNTRRVFFALWPDSQTRAHLETLSAQAHAEFGGRRMRAETLHMTLAFIGDIDAARVDLALATGDELGARPGFSMTIDRLRCWRHNRIVWCGPQRVPAALAETASQLGQHLSAAGFRLEARPFAAHATLLRNADCSRSAPDFVPFGWAVRQIVLVEASLASGGARYEIIGRWPLAE